MANARSQLNCIPFPRLSDPSRLLLGDPLASLPRVSLLVRFCRVLLTAGEASGERGCCGSLNDPPRPRAGVGTCGVWTPCGSRAVHALALSCSLYRSLLEVGVIHPILQMRELRLLEASRLARATELVARLKKVHLNLKNKNRGSPFKYLRIGCLPLFGNAQAVTRLISLLLQKPKHLETIPMEEKDKF